MLILVPLVLGFDVLPFAPLRALIAVPFMLVAPGYLVTKALHPLRSAGFAHKLLYTFTLSIAINIVVGFLLHWTPWGLTQTSWVVAITVVCAAAAMIALRRGNDPPSSTPVVVWMRRNRWGMSIMLVALILVSGAVWMAALPPDTRAVHGYTTLWLVPATNSASTGVQVGVQSMEFAEQSYTLELQRDGRAMQTWNITLAPGQQWENDVDVTLGTMSSDFDAVLYRRDVPDQVYRRVSLRMEP
jgi:uncharacterized membrane protein